MNEREKMLSGAIYKTGDSELRDELHRAKDLCWEYNQTRPSDRAKRKEIINSLIGERKGSYHIEQPFWCDYGSNISLGDNFYANHNTVILDAAKVTFGDNVFVAPNCGFYTAGHPVDVERRNAELEYAWPITVGDNVWIGGGVHVMPGVSIGSGTIIAGGSVVTKNIPENVIAGGNPCRVIRPVTDDDRTTDFKALYEEKQKKQAL